MPRKRQVVKARQPEVSPTLLYFLSGGKLGGPPNPYELIEYQYPSDAMKKQLRQLRKEWEKTK